MTLGIFSLNREFFLLWFLGNQESHSIFLLWLIQSFTIITYSISYYFGVCKAFTCKVCISQTPTNLSSLMLKTLILLLHILISRLENPLLPSGRKNLETHLYYDIREYISSAHIILETGTVSLPVIQWKGDSNYKSTGTGNRGSNYKR